jgi:hypothetical protein
MVPNSLFAADETAGAAERVAFVGVAVLVLLLPQAAAGRSSNDYDYEVVSVHP